MTEEDIEKDILASWKEISAFLGYDVRTCQRWEKEAGLPVHRVLDSSKSRVFAFKQEIDEWMNSRTQDRPKNKRKYLYLLIPAALLILTYLVFIFPYSSSQPHDFKIKDSKLVVLNKNGKKLWDYDTGIKSLRNEEFYRLFFQFKRISENRLHPNFPLLVIQDINQDKEKEVLFVPRSLIPENDTYGLCCLNSKGKENWTYAPGRAMKFGEKLYPSDYTIKGLEVIDLNQDNRVEILILSFNINMFPTTLSVLDPKGEVKREYWNSGRITDLVFYDLDEDEEIEIMLAGCNNEYNKGFLAVLEPDFKSGSSPQTGYYRSSDLMQGVEHQYILFPGQDLGNPALNRNPMGRINIIDEKSVSVESQSGLIYEFDFDFALKEIRFADRYEDFYNEAYQKGLTKSKFTAKTMAELKSELMAQISYFNGRRWVPTPVSSENKPIQ